MAYTIEQRSSFIPDELEELEEWLDVMEPDPGTYNFGDPPVKVKIRDNQTIVFLGRGCPTCRAAPGVPCHPDCPERG